MVSESGLKVQRTLLSCLNPCYSGRWSRRRQFLHTNSSIECVLILVIAVDGLGVMSILTICRGQLGVLILVIAVDGLGAYITKRNNGTKMLGLNPCYSGRWSRRVPNSSD